VLPAWIILLLLAVVVEVVVLQLQMQEVLVPEGLELELLFQLLVGNLTQLPLVLVVLVEQTMVVQDLMVLLLCFLQ